MWRTRSANSMGVSFVAIRKPNASNSRTAESHADAICTFIGSWADSASSSSWGFRRMWMATARATRASEMAIAARAIIGRWPFDPSASDPSVSDPSVSTPVGVVVLGADVAESAVVVVVLDVVVVLCSGRGAA